MKRPTCLRFVSSVILVAGLSTVAVPAVAQSPAASQGLDALPPERLLAELADRGLQTLLEREFDRQNVPAEQRQGVLMMAALHDLTDPGRRLTAEQRRDLIAGVVGKIEQSLPTIKDPKLLVQQANALLTRGLESQLNVLEYWGENPRLQEEVRPVAAAVLKLYDAAIALATAEADALANQINNPSNTVAIKKWEEADALVATATYSRNMAAYNYARALDKASQERTKVAADAIAYLSQFDNPDSGVQPVVRNRIAKFHTAAGEFDKARELFATVATPDPAIVPVPEVVQRYEAVYFGAQSQLLAGNLPAARDALKALRAWQMTNLPADPAARAGADAAARMLEFRIADAEASALTDPAARGKAADAANAVLLALVQDRPDLRPIVFERLLDRLPTDPDLKTLDPLLLQAIVRKGEGQLALPQDQKPDVAVLERATAAALELASRSATGITPAMTDRAALLAGFFQLRGGSTAQAAGTFLSFAESRPVTDPNAAAAMDSASAAIARLRNEDPQNDQIAPLTDRFLPLAIDKFGRDAFAFEYARRLQLAGRYADSVKYYVGVPDTDPRAPQARFFEMVALKQQLDDTANPIPPEPRTQMLVRIQSLADQVMSGKLAASESLDPTLARAMVVRTSLLAADLARREQKDPARALSMLQDFEQMAKGLPNESDLIAEALFVRVNALMEVGRTDEATQSLVTLLNARPGGEGSRIVFDLLKRLDQDLDKARASDDMQAMRVLAKNRAQLSGFLVEWAQSNADPAVKALTYRYRVFDAATKQFAADITQDPSERIAGLNDALTLYKTLQSPENVALYQKSLPPGSDPNDTDPAVILGLAFVEFDLGNFAAAQPLLSGLLSSRKLGAARIMVAQNGQDVLTDNDQFWEATYKLYASNVQLAKSGGPDADSILQDTRGGLKRLYIQWGPSTGGQTWAKDFDALRAELIPDFQVPDIDAPATTP